MSKKSKRNKNKRLRPDIAAKLDIHPWQFGRMAAEARAALERQARYYEVYGDAYQQARDDFERDQKEK
jgi:hypothetical protein